MLRFLILFTTGAVGYSLLEIFWRGYTHWTMFVLGGLCFYSLYNIFYLLDGYPLFVKAISGGALITIAEFTVGLIVTVKLHWIVWNYSAVPYNIMGQICLYYSALWALLCVPLSYFCSFLRQYIR